jgi:hypothetical protein
LLHAYILALSKILALSRETLMSIRRRTWINRDGSPGEAWLVDYVDQRGCRHTKNFALKKDAAAYHATVTVDVRQGTHLADSDSATVAEAAQLWLTSADRVGLERTTVDSYRQHVDFHIMPLLGPVKLSQLTVPMVRRFEDTLRTDRSPAMVRKVLGSLSAILADAQDRGLVAQNVVRGRARRQRGKVLRADKRQRGKLKIGIDIPSPDEIRTIIGQLDGRWRPLLLTAIFAGLRSCADYAGPTLTSSARNCTCANAPIATIRSGRRSQRPASVPSQSRRCWATSCASGNLLARKANWGWSFPTAPAVSRVMPISSTVAWSRFRWPSASRTGRAMRNTPGCTRSDTFTHRGASTGKSTVASSCR